MTGVLLNNETTRGNSISIITSEAQCIHQICTACLSNKNIIKQKRVTAARVQSTKSLVASLLSGPDRQGQRILLENFALFCDGKPIKADCLPSILSVCLIKRRSLCVGAVYICKWSRLSPPWALNGHTNTPWVPCFPPFSPLLTSPSPRWQL